MKTFRSFTSGILVSALLIGCQRDSHKEIFNSQPDQLMDAPATVSATGKASNQGGPCNSNAYDVVLESRTLTDGNWEWVWSVRNPNPGNGNNGTSKDLSHWGIRMAVCVPATIVGAGYSPDGATWTNFTPEIQSDPSQDCLTTPTLKFDYGTNGSAKSYYRLVVNREFNTGSALAYWKAGRGCCTFNITGISCSSGPVEIIE